MAPEILEGGKINEKVDIYSFGMILYEMSTNLIPFKGLNHVQIATKVCVKKERPIIPNESNPKIKELATKCWEGNPSLRQSSIQILAQLERILMSNEFNSIKEEYISSEWDFPIDFLNFNGNESNDNLGWKNKSNYSEFKFFEININSLTFPSSLFNYEINLEYCLTHTIEYCEWNRIENIIKKEYYSPSIFNEKNNSIRIMKIYAIQNENLNKKFKSNIIQYENEIENNPKSFGIKTWEGDKNEKWRDCILEHFKSISEQFSNKNGLNNEIKIIPLFYFLKNEELGWKICSQGFNPSNNSFLDNGWMGKGIYFSSNLEYLLNPNIHQELEIDSNGEYSILLSYVLIVNVYPCIEDPNNSTISLKGKSNKVK